MDQRQRCPKRITLVRQKTSCVSNEARYLTGTKKGNAKQTSCLFLAEISVCAI